MRIFFKDSKRPIIQKCLFSDESSFNNGQFHSIGALDIDKDICKAKHEELKEIISKHNISEFKWSELTGHSSKYKCAEELMDWVLVNANSGAIRANILIWDTNDFRHKLKGRDDNENFARMYYHLLNHIVNKSDKDVCFDFFPDEKNGFDWQTLQDCVCNKHKSPESVPIEKTEKGWVIDFSDLKSRIELKTPLSSEDCVFIQLADLLAGLAVFSYREYKVCQEWKRQAEGQSLLFEEENQIKISNSVKDKCKILFYMLSHRLKGKSISFNSSNGLCSFNPNESINFWLYKPQHMQDKAPQRMKKNATNK